MGSRVRNPPADGPHWQRLGKARRWWLRDRCRSYRGLRSSFVGAWRPRIGQSSRAAERRRPGRFARYWTVARSRVAAYQFG